ncbi:MAG: stage II sporulation protein D [Firmicutes bacterium]|nr:stage II sporulation protein D [Bacillota bacterium]
MKNKVLLAVVTILSVILAVEPKSTILKEIEVNDFSKRIDVKDGITGNVENKELEDYVVGVVAAEMPASFDMEALKAQAIASRTYAYYKMIHSDKTYDVISDISDQAYITNEQMKEKWQDDYEEYYRKVKKAVNDTKNEIMTYNGEVIKSFYFSMSNGYTEEVASVFKESYPYLKSVKSQWDNPSLKNYEVIAKISTEDFCNKLFINCQSIVINNQKYDKTGRTTEIIINSKVFNGTDFRKLLDLRSTDFKIQISESEVIIKTKGYGHGVGMSQYGANGMAKEGYNYHEILNYYYQNIDFSKI